MQLGSVCLQGPHAPIAYLYGMPGLGKSTLLEKLPETLLAAARAEPNDQVLSVLAASMEGSMPLSFAMTLEQASFPTEGHAETQAALLLLAAFAVTLSPGMPAGQNKDI